MGTLIICTLWTLAAGFMGYSIANARNMEKVRRMQRDIFYLKRWLHQQVRATRETDLELELERMRHA